MKKKITSFLVCLLILIAFGGFVFFIGWTQFKIEPSNVGILVSKTSGINNKPVYPGTFSWHWEFLIPTNAQLKMFTQEPYIISKNVKGTLPNGEIYQQKSRFFIRFKFFNNYKSFTRKYIKITKRKCNYRPSIFGKLHKQCSSNSNTKNYFILFRKFRK